MNHYAGEIAALATSLCWSFGSIFFTLASRRIGSNTVNRVRLALALVVIMLTHLAITGHPVPVNATARHWFWFGLSGVIGFSIGDTLLFRAFFLIGPRLSMLMMALAPVMGAAAAWIFLGEVLRPMEMAAIVMTLGGIAWVIKERQEKDAEYQKRSAGILCGIGAAAGQALGLILSKQGLNDGFAPLSGNFIRVLLAVVSLWFVTGVTGRIPSTLRKMSDSRAVGYLSGGVMLGPFLGVWLSLIAVQKTYVGIASTLMALPPIILIPLSHWVFKERITPGAVIGTLVAIAGVAVLFLV